MLSSVHPTRQKPNTYAITISTFLQHSHFQREANAGLFISKLFAYRDKGKFALHGFAVMPNHVHVLVTPAADLPTSRSVQLIKGGYSFAVRKQSTGEIWHSGHHEHRVRDASDYRNQLLYIANNPIEAHLAEDYPFVHTHNNFANKLDPQPPHIL